MPIPSSLATKVIELAISKGSESSFNFEGPPKEAILTSSNVIHVDPYLTDLENATDTIGVTEL